VTVLLAALFGAAVVVDVLALLTPGAGAAGLATWAGIWVAIAVAAVGAVVDLVRKATDRPALLLPLAAAAAVSAIALAHLTDPRTLHGETTQEVGCALLALSESPSRGFTSDCLFGYPARQYLPSVASTLLFGRSLLGLHLGSALAFVAGVAIFTRGLLVHLGSNPLAPQLSAMALALLGNFHFLHFFAVSFEQSVLPAVLTLMLVGMALSTHRQRRLLDLWLTGLVVLLLAHAYTPALASVGLALGWLAALSFDRRLPPGLRRTAAAVAAGSAVSTLCSLLYRKDLALWGERSPAEVLADLGEAFRSVAVRAVDPHFVASNLATGFLLAALLIALAGVVGVRAASVAAWIVAVFLAAVSLKGYVWYGVPFRLHRALVAAPVWAALIALLGRRLLPPGRRTTCALVAVLAGLAVTAGVVHRDALADRGRGEVFAFIEWWRRLTPRDPAQKARLYLLHPPRPLENLDDYLQYFEPTVRAYPLVGEQACDDLQRALTGEMGRGRTFLLASPAQLAPACIDAARWQSRGVFCGAVEPPGGLYLFERSP
jgi:hypothetical protein